MRLYFDYETRSLVDLQVRGLANYVADPSTKLLLCAYALDNDPVKLWDADSPGATVPVDFLEAMNDPFVTKVAWNATFERLISRRCLKLDVPLCEWLDVMVWARHLSLPGKLEKVGPILGLGMAHSKLSKSSAILMIKEGGRDLIKMFCEPCHEGGEETLFGTTEPWFRGRGTNPREWEDFGKYVMQDVETMRAALARLEAFPLPAEEQELWEIDQRINERGVPVDLDLAIGAGKVADMAKVELVRKLRELAAVDNPSSQPQMIKFLKGQGYPFSSIGKPFVKRALAGEGELTELGRQVLTLKQQVSKTSSTKLEIIRDRVSQDGRVRYQFSFMGAPRTGRWSGGSDDEGTGGIQMQNLPSPTKEVKKDLAKAIKLLKAADYDAVVREFPNPLEVVGSCIRSVFRAPSKKRFVVADLSGIESRMAAWLTGCKPLLQVFLDGRDPYIDLAADIYGIPYESLVGPNGEILPEHAEKRQGGKVGILGCGYQLSGGEELQNSDGDQIKTGLWGFAKSLGVELTKEDAHRIVKVFRKKYHEIEQAWYDYDKAAIDAIKSGQPRVSHRLTFEPHGKDMLRVVLPSGRALHYIKPRVEKQFFTDRSGNQREKDGITYEGIVAATKQWGRLNTHGGKWLENATQAAARDILAHGMKLAEQRGLEVVLHCHDELAVIAPDHDPPLALQNLIECMTSVPAWATGLPLEAKGYFDKIYRKD